MKHSVPVLFVAITILAHQGMAQDLREHKRPKAAPAPVVTKYDKMQKKVLQEALKTLQKEVLAAEQAAVAADTQAHEARKAYNAASDDEKPDALLLLCEAEAKGFILLEAFRQEKSDFEAARKAYLNLLLSEHK